MPREDSCTETLVTTLVLGAAMFCWANALLHLGPVGLVGFAVEVVAAGWVWHRRTTPGVADRPFLIGGLIALALGIAFQFATADVRQPFP